MLHGFGKNVLLVERFVFRLRRNVGTISLYVSPFHFIIDDCGSIGGTGSGGSIGSGGGRGGGRNGGAIYDLMDTQTICNKIMAYFTNTIENTCPKP
jgi:hypothetical protein